MNIEHFISACLDPAWIIAGKPKSRYKSLDPTVNGVFPKIAAAVELTATLWRMRIVTTARAYRFAKRAACSLTYSFASSPTASRRDGRPRQENLFLTQRC